MPSLFDIAKSGVQSYRQALAVTGQNIANIIQMDISAEKLDLPKLVQDKAA